MRHDLSQGLLRHIFERVEVTILVVASARQLLNFIPDLVVVVPADALRDVQLLRKVAEIYRAMVPQQEVGEFERVLHFDRIGRLNVLLKLHLHEEGFVRP